MIRRLLLATLALVMLSAAPATALSFDPTLFSLLDDPSATLISQRVINLHPSGAIDIRYGPDAASGCASHAGCAYSGRLTLVPGSDAALQITTESSHGHRVRVAELNLGETALTYANVRRSSGGECTDAGPANTVFGDAHGAALRFSLAGALGSVRCAAPLPADLATALPTFTVSAAGLVPGRHIDLHTTGHFSGHGFTGTVTSTLGLTVGHANQPFPFSGGSSTGAHKVRAVSVVLRLTGEAGAVKLQLRGPANGAVCDALDTCGLSGTETLASRPASSQGILTAYGPVGRPRRDFLTALGLAHGGNPRGLTVIGSVVWRDQGTVTADLQQGATCRDTARLGDGFLFLVGSGGRLRVSAPYLSGRTRCPGPLIETSGSGLTGTVPAGRDVTVAMRPFGSLDDDGFSVIQTGRLALRLHRGRVSQRVIVSPLF